MYALQAYNLFDGKLFLPLEFRYDPLIRNFTVSHFLLRRLINDQLSAERPHYGF